MFSYMPMYSSGCKTFFDVFIFDLLSFKVNDNLTAAPCMYTYSMNDQQSK